MSKAQLEMVKANAAAAAGNIKGFWKHYRAALEAERSAS